MLSFSEYTNDLDEALITFGGKANPRFGQIVIMAGGAGSGKGFVKDKLVGMDGYTFDVDALKMLAIRTPAIVSKVKADMDIDISKLDPKRFPGALKDPDNVFKLHTIVGDVLGLDDKRKKALFASALTAPADRKPNMIFDVTLKSITQLQKYTLPLQEIGYKKENIHIVWVVNDIEVAKAQNAKRDRTVPVEILVGTHRGTSQTMSDIITMGNSLRSYMDGEIVFAFNKVGVDTELVKSGKGGSYIVDANYVYVKRRGKPVEPKKLTTALKAKLSQYVPPTVNWVDI
jgi:hypothetical protein